MGFLKHLFLWPVTGPMYLAEFSLEKVQGVVKEHLTDDSPVKEKLLDLQLRLELGEIDDDQFVEEEAAIMLQLREVRRWREEFGMATRGGAVRVSRDPDGVAQDPDGVSRDQDRESQDEGAAPSDATASGSGTEEEDDREPTVLTGDVQLDISVDFGDEDGWSSVSWHDSDDDSSSS